MFTLILLNLFFSLNCLASSFNTSATKYLTEKKVEIRIQNIRLSKSYERIYEICSNTIELTKLRYTIAAAEQVGSLAFGSVDEIIHILKTKQGLSSLLLEDLYSDGFAQAIKDCRYSKEQTNILVISLIILDSSGKLLGGIGVFKLFKVLTKYLQIIKRRSIKTYYALMTAGFTSTAYHFYKSTFEEEVLTGTGSVINEAKDLELIINEGQTADDHLDDFEYMVLNRLKNKLEDLLFLLENDQLSNQETVSIQNEIEEVRIKIGTVYLMKRQF